MYLKGMVSSKLFKYGLKKDLFLQRGEDSPLDILITIRYK